MRIQDLEKSLESSNASSEDMRRSIKQLWLATTTFAGKRRARQSSPTASKTIPAGGVPKERPGDSDSATADKRPALRVISGHNVEDRGGRADPALKAVPSFGTAATKAGNIAAKVL